MFIFFSLHFNIIGSQQQEEQSLKKLIALIPFSFVLCTLYLFSCNTTESPSKEVKPPGYQEDIPWPSLADSPWPMFRGDPQNTGRSKGIGPNLGIIEWSIDTFYVKSGVAFGPDSTIYFISRDPPGLVALNLKGTVKWIFPIDENAGYDPLGPVVDSDGSIYITSPREKRIYAINSNGTLKWAVENTFSSQDDIGMNISLDGTIYFRGIINGTAALYAVDKQGFIKWTFIHRDLSDGMSFSPDGKTLYISGVVERAVYSLDIETQTINWEFGKDILYSYHPPLVDSKGNIYVISEDDSANGVLYSLSAEGEIRWSYILGDKLRVDANDYFAMDKSGNLYLGLHKLKSIDYNGNLRWEFELDTNEWISSPIVADQNSVIYFMVGVDDITHEFYALKSNGEILWKTIYPGILNYGENNYGFAGGYQKLVFPGYEAKVISLIR